MIATFGRSIERVLFSVLVVAILAYALFPFYWAIKSSLTAQEQLFSTPVQLLPRDPTLANYAIVFGSGEFLTALANSTIVAILVVALSLALGATAAYALGRLPFRGRTPVLYVILAMTMFPQVTVLGALFTMLSDAGLYNTLGALVLTYLLFDLPFTVWVLTSFFRAMPRELEEAAYVDGATPFQTFLRVLLPLAAPGLVTTGLLAFIASWNEFLFALSFTQTPDVHTVPVAIQSFAPTAAGNSYEVPWGPIMAATVVVTVPLIVLVVVFQRRIVAGLTAGAVKG